MSVNTKVNGQLVKSAGLYKASVPIQSGDIYSFEERQVGVYADGKPLYQKTVDLGSDVTISYNSWTSLTDSDIPISDIENLVSVIGLGSAGGNYGGLMAGVASGRTALNIQTGRNGDNVFVRYITLQYTKTTDAAGSGEYVPSGDKAVHYSTDEEVIGTWLGETLYRKLVTTSGSVPSGATLIYRETRTGYDVIEYTKTS